MINHKPYLNFIRKHRVRYKNNTPTTIIPPGEYTLELLQQLIPGIELTRGDGCEKSVITLKVLDGIQIAFEPELIDLLGLDPQLSTGWMGLILIKVYEVYIIFHHILSLKSPNR